MALGRLGGGLSTTLPGSDLAEAFFASKSGSRAVKNCGSSSWIHSDGMLNEITATRVTH